ncbi:hypothetical protein LBMAG48_23920 [Phycisphaerae bacterium]|nr:hypothetical protein LBMAG48_23920 [Phycisphaerae bacterium]
MFSLLSLAEIRRGVVSCALSLIASAAALGQAPVLSNAPLLLDGVQPAVAEESASADLSWLGSATGLEGGVLRVAPYVSLFAASAFEPNWGGRELDGIDLARGVYAPLEIDLMLPTRGPAWPVARTLAPTSRWQPAGVGSDTFVDNTDAAGRLTGALGPRWMASGTPTVARHSSGGIEYLVVFFGADRYATFARNSGTQTYKGVNGAAGAAMNVSQDSVNVIEFTLADGHRFVFFAPEVAGVGGRLWKIVGPDGKHAYAGHATNAATAITDGFDSGGRLLTAFDGAGRRFAYAYTTSGLLDLVQVFGVADPNVVIASVDYEFYQAGAAHGAVGDLKTVKVSQRASEGSTNAMTWETTGYRYSQGKLVVEVRPDGYRRMLANGLQIETAGEAQLAPFAWWRFGYGTDGRLVSASGGGAESRTLLFLYDGAMVAGTPGYDAGVRLRTSVGIFDTSGGQSSLLRTDEYLFDEFAQSLGVVTRGPQAGGTWARGLTRDAFGRVEKVHEPSNVISVTDGASPLTFAPDAGLVTRVERIPAGLLQGFPRAVVRTIGNAPLAARRADLRMEYWQETANDGRMQVGDAEVVHVLAKYVTRFRDATSQAQLATGQTTSYEYKFAATGKASIHALRLRNVYETPPVVSRATENGLDESINTDVRTFFAPSGDETLTRTASGRLHFTKYDPVCGREQVFIHDARSDDPAVSAIVATSSYSSSAAGAAALHRVTTTTYDQLGRSRETMSYRGLRAGTWYGATSDGATVVVSNPHRNGSTYVGPAQVAVIDSMGSPVAWGQVSPRFGGSNWVLGRLTTSSQSPLSWVDLAKTKPIAIIAGRLGANLLGRGMHLIEKSPDGARAIAVRRYHDLGASLSDDQDLGLIRQHYDRWTLEWDGLGRNVATTTPAGTTRRKTLDLFGRTVAQRLEVMRNGSLQSHVVRSFEFDGGQAGGDGRLTASVEHPEPGILNVTRLGYNAWGQLRAVRRPAAPHWLSRSNNWGQVEALAALESMPDWTGSALPVLPEPDGASVPARRALLTKSYDSRGRQFRRSEWRVDQVTGALPANCTDCIGVDAGARTLDVVFGPEGSIRATSGTSNTVNSYNRACELTQIVQLVTLDTTSVRGATSSIVLNPLDVTESTQYHVDPRTGYVDAQSVITAGCGEEPSALPRFTLNEGGQFALQPGGNILARHERTYRDLIGRPIAHIDFGMPRAPYGSAYGPAFEAPYDRHSPPPFKPVDQFDDVLQDDEPADNQYRQTVKFVDEFGDVVQEIDPNGDVTVLDFDDAGRVVGSGEGDFDGIDSNGGFSTRACSPNKWKDIEYKDDRVEQVRDTCLGINCANPPVDQILEIDYPNDSPRNPQRPTPDDPFTGQPWKPGSYDNETPLGMYIIFDPQLEAPQSPPESGPAFGYPPELYTQRVDALGRRTGFSNQAGTLRTMRLDGVGRPVLEYVTPGTVESADPESQLRATIMSWSHSYDGLGRKTGTQFVVSNSKGDDWVNQDQWMMSYNSAGLPTHSQHYQFNFGGNRLALFEHSWNWTLPAAGTQNYRLASSHAGGGGFVASFSYSGSTDTRAFDAGRTTGMTLGAPAGGGNSLPVFQTNMCGSGGATNTGTFGGNLISPPGGGVNVKYLQQDFDPSMAPNMPQDWEFGGVNRFGEPSRENIKWCAGSACDPQMPTEDFVDSSIQRDGIGNSILQVDHRLLFPYDELLPSEVDIDTTPICNVGATATLTPGPTLAVDRGVVAPRPIHVGAHLKIFEQWKSDAIGNLIQYRRGSMPDSACTDALSNDCGQGPGDIRLSRIHDGLDRINIETRHVVPASGGASVAQTHQMRYDVAGNTVDSGGEYLYEYDLLGRLSGAYRRQAAGPGLPDIRGLLFARFTYDSLGRLRSAAYDLESEDGDLENENVDWYAYDDRWRLVAVYRQDFKYQEMKLRERYAYGDRGIGARESGGAGHKLDCPLYAEMDGDGDGTLERRVMYLQDRAGHVIGVFDTALARQDSPTDTTPGLYPVRIAYTAFGVPVNVGASGLGLDEGLQDVNGMPGSRLDVDFDNDGYEDDRTSPGGPGTGSDLEKLIAAVNAGSSSNCGSMINGVMQPCDTADFNRDGEVNGDDITAFIAAKQGTYYVPAGDIGEYRFLYRGYWYDRHLHIYHVRHRAYDPEIQRWLQPDPAYFVDGLNRYAYCGNEPVHMYDPMGLWAWDDDWVETIIDVVTQREVAKNFVQGASDGFLVTTNAAVQVVTVGMAGYSQQQLDAIGMLYDAENPQLAASRYAGYTAGGALLAASLVSGISSTTGATMEVHLGFMRNGKFHMMYSSQGVYAHAFGRAGGSYIVTSRAVESAFVGRSLTLAGIPIRNSAAAMMTGGSAYSCVTAAGKAFVRGWRKLP